MAANEMVNAGVRAVQVDAPPGPSRHPDGDGARRGPPGPPVSVPCEISWQRPPDPARRRAAREARYWLRRGLWRVTSLPRVAHCGRFLTGDVTRVHVKAGSAYYCDVQTCGSVWSCPVCAARIRQRRAGEIETACVSHLGAGGSIGFLTLTFPHTRDDDLAEMLRVLARCWERVQQRRGYRARKDALRLFGFIRATEVTYGGWHGWHPHLHLLLFAEGTVTADDWAQLRGWLSDAWAEVVVKAGRDRPGEAVGVTLAPVRTAEVGAYLAKVQDHYGAESSIGREMARSDAKRGRKRSRTPFELLEQAVLGVVPELPLWHTYEAATKGRHAIDWSRGLKARFAVEDVDDEDLAQVDVDGEAVATLDAREYALIVQDGAEAHVLDLAEDGGGAAVHAFLSRLRGSLWARGPVAAG